MPFTYVTLAQAKTFLAARLADVNQVFWSNAELAYYIVEALRTWNALTAMWAQDYTFSILSPASVVWYPLYGTAGYPRVRTVTDAYLYTMMQYHLLEPPTGAGTWTGSSQFALSDLQNALQRRRDEFIQFSSCNLAQFNQLATVNARRVILPDTTLEVRRTRFVPAFGSPTTLWRADAMSFQDFSPSYLQGTPSPGQQPPAPQQYDVSSNPPLALDVDYAPQTAGNFDIVGLQSGATFNPPAATLLGVPDDFSWVAKWGALSDLLGSENERNDPLRADYCLQRYKDGVTLATKMPWIVAARLNNIPVDTVSVAEMDQYSAEWDTFYTTTAESNVGTTGIPINVQVAEIPSGLVPGAQLQVDSGSQQETVVPTAVFQIGALLLFTATYTKTHLAPFPIVPLPQPNIPPCIVDAGPDFIAVAPVPTLGNTSVFLTVIGNAPVPVLDTDDVQVERDVLDVLLDYAQHLASFKQGGAEFAQTKDLFKNFALSAMSRNSRLEALGLFRDVLLSEGQRQIDTQEKFAPQEQS